MTKKKYKLDGYYKHKTKWTRQEIEQNVLELYPCPVGRDVDPEEICEVMVKREEELERQVEYFKSREMFAEPTDDCYHYYIFEYNGKKVDKCLQRFLGCMVHGHKDPNCPSYVDPSTTHPLHTS